MWDPRNAAVDRKGYAVSDIIQVGHHIIITEDGRFFFFQYYYCHRYTGNVENIKPYLVKSEQKRLKKKNPRHFVVEPATASEILSIPSALLLTKPFSHSLSLYRTSPQIFIFPVVSKRIGRIRKYFRIRCCDPVRNKDQQFSPNRFHSSENRILFGFMSQTTISHNSP